MVHEVKRVSARLWKCSVHTTERHEVVRGSLSILEDTGQGPELTLGRVAAKAGLSCLANSSATMPTEPT